MVKCTVCSKQFGKRKFNVLAQHFLDFTSKSDPDHIGWLNRNISIDKKNISELTLLLTQFFDYNGSLKDWIIQVFIKKFFGDDIHPFVQRMQKPNPDRAVLLGYVIEHQHFLKQWVKSCALILAKSGKDDIIRYETDNIVTEYGGHEYCKTIPHVEYLIQMGISQGLTRDEITKKDPLPGTQNAIAFWNEIANTCHWVETMLAMHGLELIANKELRSKGAKVHYFNPELFNTNEVTKETKEFLREGYEADVHHASEAIALVVKYAHEYDIVDDVQSTFLQSIEVFDEYLMSRLKRASEFES